MEGPGSLEGTSPLSSGAHVHLGGPGILTWPPQGPVQMEKTSVGSEVAGWEGCGEKEGTCIMEERDFRVFLGFVLYVETMSPKLACRTRLQGAAEHQPLGSQPAREMLWVNRSFMAGRRAS